MKNILIKIKLDILFDEHPSKISSKTHSDIIWLLNKGYFNEIYLFDTQNEKPFKLEPSFEYLSQLVNKNKTFNLFFLHKDNFFKAVLSNNQGLVELCIQSIDSEFAKKFNIDLQQIPQDLSFYLECSLKLCEELEILYLNAEAAQ